MDRQLTKSVCTRSPRWVVQLGFSMLMCALLAGCAGEKWVALRDSPHNPLSERLMLLSSRGPKPTPRTVVFLRRYDLLDRLHGNPRDLVKSVQDVAQREPSQEALHAAAELAYIGGVRSQTLGKSKQALDLYGVSVAQSYACLFQPGFAPLRNPFDPEFRGACDLYNAGLEATLRAIRKQGKLRANETFEVNTNGQSWLVTVTPRGIAWPIEDVDHFEFVSDYQVDGLKNIYHTYGLGVPLIAVRKSKPENEPLDRHYPPGLSFAVTAFLRCHPDEPNQPNTNPEHRATLELYDPLDSAEIVVDGERVPLESDITTPLAFTLNDSTFAKIDQPTTGLLNPDRARKLAGIYMLEPYEPGKIPVLMVHGLWSSPITWMEMFNDLRGDPDLRRNYQFWFFLYPTGQPFWASATQLREALADMRMRLDSSRREAALDQMVLVGHSMGGLVSHMQVVNSRDDFWHIVSKTPLSLVNADEKTRKDLERTFYFQANTSVRRIITIGTPHRGTYFANDVTRYLGNKLISLPERLTAPFAMLRLQNTGIFQDTRMLDTATSIDSLSPDSPVLPALLAAQRPPWIRYDNVVGRLDKDSWQVRLFGEGDGVVPLRSAHLDDADSEIDVAAEHSDVHRHPQTILQVREILREHLRELQSYPAIQQISAARTAVMN